VSYLADYVNAVYGISYTTFRPMLFLSRESSTISVPILYVCLICKHLPFPSIDRFLFLNRPVVVRNVDPADWLLVRWNLQTYPCRTGIYDLARDSRNLRNLQHSAHPRDNGYSRPWWYFSTALLCLHRHRLLLQSVFKFSPRLSHNSYHLRLPSLLRLHRSLLLFMGVLDCS
jgi:hypothetical protein